MCEQGISEAQTASPHTTSTVERGSFCTARCACGWAGPARRSRDLARRDAQAHIEEQPQVTQD